MHIFTIFLNGHAWSCLGLTLENKQGFGWSGVGWSGATRRSKSILSRSLSSSNEFKRTPPPPNPPIQLNTYTYMFFFFSTSILAQAILKTTMLPNDLAQRRRFGRVHHERNADSALKAKRFSHPKGSTGCSETGRSKWARLGEGALSGVRVVSPSPYTTR